MDLKTLAENFGILLEGPGAAEFTQVNSQLAVYGKLVSQFAHEKSFKIDSKSKSNSKTKTPLITEPEFLYEIPSTWKWFAIGAVTSDCGQKKPDCKFSYIDVSSIDNRIGKITPDIKIISAEDAPSRARKLVRKGSVIYSTVRPYLLNIAIIETDLDPAPIVSTAFAVLHPVNGLLNRYLFWYLRSGPFISCVEQKMKGVAYPAISDAEFKPCPIPIPPTEEQHRIVAKVDHLMQLCDELEQKQEKASKTRSRLNTVSLEKLVSARNSEEFEESWGRVKSTFDSLYTDSKNIARLRLAVLQLAFSGRLSNLIMPKSNSHQSPTCQINWPRVQLREVAQMRLGKMLDKAKNKGRPYPYLRNLNVQWHRFNLDGILTMKFEDEELEEFQLKNGDVLICEGGEPGRCAIWNGNDRVMMFQKALHRVRTSSALHNEFLVYHLLCSALSGQLDRYFTGATIKHFTGKSLSTYELEIPPYSAQIEIVERVKAIFANTRTLEDNLKLLSSKQETVSKCIQRLSCPNVA